MSTAKSKPQFRDQFGSARKALSAGDVASYSDRITTHLFALAEIQSAAHVAIYLARPHEVQTSASIASLRDQGKAISIPVYDPARDGYAFAQVPADESALTRGPLGIPQPADPAWVAGESIDVILVPGVAFTPEGARLGHGAGIYDRLLAECPAATYIGLAFACQLAEDLPVDPHDIPMHWIVTENGITFIETKT